MTCTGSVLHDGVALHCGKLSQDQLFFARALSISTAPALTELNDWTGLQVRTKTDVSNQAFYTVVCLF